MSGHISMNKKLDWKKAKVIAAGVDIGGDVQGAAAA